MVRDENKLKIMWDHKSVDVWSVPGKSIKEKQTLADN